ncbi:sensor histidine kinase [Halalkalibacter hemicellulosilyticus]|uniref:histidine kinase n=1 Tax=Halalkalibacter hemicellulosilyticusJCM 9152 TaxID=1236971 RepID=W4Q9S0_9BACI|nr:sensor histidine kinase [Halalkalibacter hemicellulosilyticus]GAE28750.1 two-component sensor histidine kinase [Halalkalibacter hemicellulosilyticusJCM 9152]
MNKLINKIDQWTSNILVHPKLLVTFYIVSLLPLAIVSSFMYVNSTQALKEELGSHIVETSRQVDLRMNSFIGEMGALSRIVHFDPDVQRFLNLKDQTEPTSLSWQLDLRHFLRNIVSHREYLWSVFLINDHGGVIYYSEDFVNPVFASWWHQIELDHDFHHDPIYQKIVREKEFLLYQPHKSDYYNGDYVVTFGGRLYQLNKERGTLLFNFDPDYFASMSNSIHLGDTGYVAIFSEEGDLLFEHDKVTENLIDDLPEFNILKEESGYELVDLGGEQTLIAINTSENTGWKYIGVVPFHEVSGKISSIQNGIYLMAVTSLVIIFVFSKYLARVITRPLFTLQNYMKRAEQGNLSLRVPLEREDEFGMLTRAFNRMIERLELLRDKVYVSEIKHMKLQLLNRESELKTLQMQINPHFLYNTLNTMKCVGEVYNVKEVSEMSESLSDMFRYSIDQDKFKLFEEEINHVKAFLKIIQIRFPNQVDCHFDIDSSLFNLPVLKLILQPIVENAVEHGITPKASRGIINISARKESDGLLIEIVDDGIGMSDTKLKELQDTIYKKTDSNQGITMNSSHIGLSNVHQRLTLSYHGSGGLEIDSEYQTGTTVTVRIPIHNE